MSSSQQRQQHLQHPLLFFPTRTQAPPASHGFYLIPSRTTETNLFGTSTPDVFCQYCHEGQATTARPSLPKMPDHWRSDFPCIRPRFLRCMVELIFAALCMVAFGQPSLRRKWEKECASEEDFTRHKDLLASRINTIAVMGTILLASIAAFVTTAPPEQSIINYTIRGPYICMWASFGLLLGGVIVASTTVYVLATSGQEWVNSDLMATRSRVWCVLVLLSYPFLSIGAGVAVCVMGLLSAAWLSQDAIVRIGCVFLLLVPVGLLLAFLLTTRGSLMEMTTRVGKPAEAHLEAGGDSGMAMA